MLRAITILLLSSVISLAADAKPQQEEFRLRATVLDIVVLSNHSGSVIPVEFDPQFALTMRIRSVTPSLAHFAKGATVTFAIHSPASLFLSENPKGKTHDFTLRRETTAGKTRWLSLEIRR